MMMPIAAQQQENIITTGLNLHFDANDKTSTSSPSAWGDMKCVRSGSMDPTWTLTNGAALDTSTFDHGTIHFDGTNDYITGDTDHLDDVGAEANRPGGNMQFTFDAWINISAYAPSTANEYWFAAIISKGNVYFNFGIRHNGYLKLYWYPGSVYYTLSETTVLGLDRWRHVAMTVAENGLIALYVDGEADAIDSSSTATSFTDMAATGLTQAAEIGTGDFGTQTNMFNGHMAVLRQYHRCLTPGEIRHNFNAQRHRFGV